MDLYRTDLQDLKRLNTFTKIWKNSIYSFIKHPKLQESMKNHKITDKIYIEKVKPMQIFQS